MLRFSTLALALACPLAAGAAPGYEDMAVPLKHSARMLAGAVWYPAEQDGTTTDLLAQHPVFQGVELQRGATPRAEKAPVVLFSHGWGGNFRAQGWLAAALAERGALVITVNHPGSSSGDMGAPEVALNHGTRARDLSAALDWVMADPRFAGQIDPQRIYAAGFSYGGWTALALGGATTQLSGFAAYCEAVATRTDFCALVERMGFDAAKMDEARWSASYKDTRVRGVIAIDPGFTYGTTAKNVAALPEDVTLMTLGTGADRLRATDTSPSGSGFAALLPKARTVTLDPAWHFTAMPLCTDAGAAILREERDDPVCDDPEGSDRAAKHAEIIEVFSEALGL